MFTTFFICFLAETDLFATFDLNDAAIMNRDFHGSVLHLANRRENPSICFRYSVFLF